MESLVIILPVIAVGCVVFISGVNLYFKVRNKFPIRVNCWFCNNNTDVPYGNRNSWDCPNCEQYNGFLPDGGYNKAIPAQHDELLNRPVHAVFPRKKTNSDANGNGLCRKCNINQELKVQQLAMFTPINPAHYDEEVDEFRHHLENAYHLCSPCEEVLKQTLHKHKSLLLGVRLKQLHNNSLRGKGLLSILKVKLFQLSWVHVTHYITLMLAASLVLAISSRLNKGQLPFPAIIQNSTFWSAVEAPQLIVSLLPVILSYEIPLTALGIIAQFAAFIPRKPGKFGIICLCPWIILHVQSWLMKWKKVEKYITLLDFGILHLVVAFLTLCVCTWDALVAGRRCIAVECHNITQKNETPNSFSESSCHISNVSDDTLTSATKNCQQKHVNNALQSQDDSELAKVRDFCHVSGTLSPLHASLSPCVGQPSLPVISACEDDTSEDLGRGFGSLTLGSSSCEKWINRKNNAFSLFETKVYGENRCSELFNGNLRNRKRPIIRPSQLGLCKNITQSSWVAGGYWQSAVHSKALPLSGSESQEISAEPAFTPLSRSSSQSSGFVSQSSQPGVYDGATSLPNSRTGSICGAEFDSFSALSEPVYSCTSSPVCYAGARPGTFIGAPYYAGPPVVAHQPYGMVPQLPGFLPNYGPPQQQMQPVPCYYAPRPLSTIWNPPPFSRVPVKEPQTPSPDVLSRSSSQNSNDSRGCSTENIVKHEHVRRHRTFVSAIHEHMFLAILFVCSLLFNVLIIVGVMLWNSNLLFSGILS